MRSIDPVNHGYDGLKGHCYQTRTFVVGQRCRTMAIRSAPTPQVRRATVAGCSNHRADYVHAVVVRLALIGSGREVNAKLVLVVATGRAPTPLVSLRTAKSNKSVTKWFSIDNSAKE